MKKGFSLLEVLISFVFLAIITISMYPILGWLIVKSENVEYDTEAALVLQEGMEVAVNILSSSWDRNFVIYPAGIYHPAVLDNTDPIRDSWVLVTGGESGIYSKYDRTIKIWPVCRKTDTGEASEADSSQNCIAPLVIDYNSKMITSVVTWREGTLNKSIKSSLLITYFGETL